MTLLYRGIWRDDRPTLLGDVEDEFVRWLDSKRLVVDLPREGSVESVASAGPFEVTVRRGEVGSVTAVQFQLDEDRPETGERWSTSVTGVVDAASEEQWAWVDLSRVSRDVTRFFQTAPPRLAAALIESGKDCRVDQVRIETRPYAISASGAAGLIRNAERTLPVILFSHDPAFDERTTLDRAAEVQRCLVGAAQVMLLPTSEEQELKERLGEELAVWAGAARIYLPNADAAGLRSERHRYVLPARMTTPRQAARILGSMIGPVMTARRPPDAYEQVRRSLRRTAGSSDTELLELALAEVEELRRERDHLKQELVARNDELLDTQIDFECAVEEADALRRQIRVIARGVNGEADVDVDDEPDPETIADAVEAARRRLRHLVVHENAERDLEELDAHNNAAAWARTAWRGLRALDAYAAEGHDGNFKDWCLTSGHVDTWPANDKKLAMTESETVRSNDRLNRKRHLPVDPAVDPSGRIHMYAHLKIAEGGGPLAPRIYFYDDTRGPTGKVHIGFVGPHSHMPNTKTN